jgi:hypothetical protein
MTRLQWRYVLHGSTALRGVQLLVPDIGDVFWELTIVNVLENADIEYSKPILDLDTFFEMGTVLVNELLDHLKHISEVDRTRLVSQHLLVSIGEQRRSEAGGHRSVLPISAFHHN